MNAVLTVLVYAAIVTGLLVWCLWCLVALDALINGAGAALERVTVLAGRLCGRAPSDLHAAARRTPDSAAPEPGDEDAAWLAQLGRGLKPAAPRGPRQRARIFTSDTVGGDQADQ